MIIKSLEKIPTLYGVSTCPFCHVAEKYLTSNSIAHHLVMVDALPADERQQIKFQLRTLTLQLHYGEDAIGHINKKVAS